MNRSSIESSEKFQELIALSEKEPIVIFKHSTRCNISAVALDRFERKLDALEGKAAYYYLDLLNHRDISTQIAATLSVEHQSPQILLIDHGKCVYTASHYDIRMEDVVSEISR